MAAAQKPLFSSKGVFIVLLLFFSVSILKAQHPDSLAQAALDTIRWDSLQRVQAFEQMRCVNIEAYLTACNFQPGGAGQHASCTLDSLHGLALNAAQAHGNLKLQIHLLNSDLVEEVEIVMGRTARGRGIYNQTLVLAEGTLDARSRLLRKKANVWEFQLDQIVKPSPLYIRLRLKSASGEYSSVYSYDLID